MNELPFFLLESTARDQRLRCTWVAAGGFYHSSLFFILSKFVFIVACCIVPFFVPPGLRP